MSKFYYAGTDIEVPESDLTRAVNSGEVEAETGSPVTVIDQAGNRVEIDPQNLAGIGNYLNQGFRVEGAAEHQSIEARLEARHSTGRALAESALSGATLGLSDVAGVAIGGDEYAQGRNLRREELGAGLDMAASAVGGIVPILATGGAGALARGVASAPAGAVARGAMSAGRAAEQAALARGASVSAAKIIGMAAEGTLDGAIAGVGQALAESSLGNAELNAEYLVSSGGMGALLGGGLGGLFGVAAARTSGARQIADRIRSETTGEAVDAAARAAGGYKVMPESLTGRIVDKVSEVGSSVTGIKKELLEEAYRNPSLRGDILNSDAVEQEINKKLRTHAQSFLDESTHMRKLFNGEVKSENLARDVLEDEVAAVAASDKVKDILGRYVAELDEMKQAGLMSKTEYTRLVNEALDTTTKVTKNLGPGRAEDGAAWKAFEGIENLKRTADTRRKRLSGRSPGDLTSRESIPRLHKLSATLGDELRQLLESEQLWGVAGRKQAARNAALHKALNNSKAFNRLTEGTGESLSADYWDVERLVLDGDKVDGFIKNILNPNREYTNDQIKQHLSDVSELYETVIRNDDVPADMIERFKKAANDAKEMGRVIEEAEERLGRIGEFKAAEAAGREVGQTIGGGAAIGGGAVVGAVVGGPIGAAVGAGLGKVMGTIANPTGLIKNIARLETVSQRVRQGQRTVQERTVTAIDRLTGKTKESNLGGRVRAASRSAATRAALAHDREEKKARMARIEKRLLELEKNATDLALAVGYQTDELAEAAPMTAMAYSQQVGKAVDFLRSKLPPANSEINFLQPSLNSRVWDDSSIDSFEKYMRAVEDPTQALKELEAGRLTSETVEALKAVYPHVYDDIRRAAIEKVADEKNPLPFNAVIQLSLLLDFNGDPSMTPSYQKILKEADEQGSPQGGGEGESSGQQRGVPATFRPVTAPQSLSARLAGGLERR